MKCKILRVPVGNDFTTRMVITAVRPDGSVIDDFRLEDADNITPSYILAGKTYEIEDFTIDGNSVIIPWTGLALGSYGFVINGYYGGGAWQMKVNTIFIIVSTNERAFIPDGTLVNGEYVINEWMSLYSPAQIQSDWDEQDTDSPAYIRNKPDLSNYATQQELAQKQNVIPDLAAIRSGAEKGATAYQKPAEGIPMADLSENVYEYVDKGYEAWREVVPAGELKDKVTAIEGKIPSAASSTNKLADVNFVNSSISTNTAYYISNNGQPFTSLAQLQAYSGPLTNNDYAFVVGTDAAGNTIYTRYKYNADTQAWSEEYILNNSSFTAAQWAAINSAITSGDVEKLAALPTKAQLDAMLAAKQDTLTFDNLPTQNSNNPVKSGGVFTALDSKAEKVLVVHVEFEAESGLHVVNMLQPNEIAEVSFVDYMDFVLGGLDNTQKCEYCIKFNVGSTIPTLSLPSEIIWAEEIELEANTHYVILISYENGGYYGDWKSYPLT